MILASAGQEAKALHETLNRPLVSVVTFCRNGKRTIRRSIESVLRQTYPNIQHVVQDGASTDGTLEILGQHRDKLELVSAPDGGTNDAFWRALLRCRGEFIAVCLADEELLPHAIERAVQEFEANPTVGAVTGDAYLTNGDGIVFGTHIGQDFDLLAYLFGDYCPNFAASFFRRSALFDIGFFEDRWKLGALATVEFELWCRLGIEHKVRYVPYIFAKYGMGEDQQSHKLTRILGELDSRFMIIDQHLFRDDHFFGVDDDLRRFIMHRQVEIIINHLNCNRRTDDAEKVRQRMCEVLGYPRSAAILPSAVDHQRAVAFSRRSKLVRGLRLILPGFVKQLIPLTYKLRFHHAVANWYEQKRAISIAPTGADSGGDVAVKVSLHDRSGPLASPEAVRARMYHRVAERYRMRGQVEQAWQMWQHTECLKDEQIASAAYQILLKIPGLTEADHARLQQKWADTYAQPIESKARVPLPFRFRKPGKRLTIAYHCVYLSADGSKAQVLPFISKHNRSRFRVIGYSPYEEPAYVRKAFDEFRATGHLDHGQFVDLARADGVDIFVELSGLSYRHRFAAMASRCAPVQVHYMNHAGTIRVPNVDYVLADAIAAPASCDIHYSEKIYRLPGSLFGFDCEEAKLPPIAPPPHLKNGYVTFGFFGHPEKLNAENLRLWADVLRGVPKSRLLIQGMSSRSHVGFIRKQFRWYGIDQQRISFLPWSDWRGVLLNYGLVDISLDTSPYCGANTIADSVYQGVPVISLRGERFASAYGASLITSCGLADLVASSREEFVSIATALSQDSSRLVSLRRDLRRMVREHGFGDSARMAEDLETAYLDMYSVARLHFAKTDEVALERQHSA